FCDRSLCLLLRLFFFSSRRRHTRSKRDWSSDVCSSDLSSLSRRSMALSLMAVDKFTASKDKAIDRLESELGQTFTGEQQAAAERSEERRVGKEGRTRGWT